MGRNQPIESLAVLPFANASGSPDAEYLSDGISESLITEQAAEECRKAIAMDPNFAWGHNGLGSVYLQQARYPEGIAELEQGLKLSRGGIMERTYVGHAYAVAGRKQEAERVIEEMKALSRQRYVPPEFLAVIYTGLGDKDRAMEWFERAYSERSMHAWFLPDPRLDGIRSDPRFADLLRRMNLAR